jgi:hypothetical protein
LNAQTLPPFPEHGQRKLTAREQVERINAHACLMPDKLATQCEGQIFAGIFFDGTGNNMDVDYYGGDGSKTLGEGRAPLPPEKRKHTNVVKLYQAFPRENEKGYFRIYIPGVGTPFPEIGDDNKFLYSNANVGSIAGEKGEHRILWALLQLLNVPHRYVKGANTLLIPNDQAKEISCTLPNSTNGQRNRALKYWQDNLTKALRPHIPKVTQINLSVFGFSRGAAEARVFVNWLMGACEYKDGGWQFAGIALNLQFLGIFDTVASVGAANLYDGGTFSGHQSWADNTLQLHPAVRQCVHMVAAHELRACFPLDSARIKSGYPSNVKEIVCMGAHSDVGGGYAPRALGVMLQPGDNLSIIPGRAMYEAARNAAVPLPSFNSLPKLLQDALTPSDSLVKAHNSYLKDAAVQSGPVEQQLRQHMALYHSFRFKTRMQFESLSFIRNASAKDADYLRKTQSKFLDILANLGGGDKDALPHQMMSSSEYFARHQTGLHPNHVSQIMPRLKDRQRSPKTNPVFDPYLAAQLFRKIAGRYFNGENAKWCDVAEHIRPQAITPAIHEFFEKYVHDSLAGFIGFGLDEGDKNDLGLVKYRTIFMGDD